MNAVKLKERELRDQALEGINHERFLRSLAVAVRMGERAKEALRQIETNGYAVGNFMLPVFNSGKEYDVVVVKASQKRRSIGRDELIPLKEIKLFLEKRTYHVTHGGKKNIPTRNIQVSGVLTKDGTYSGKVRIGEVILFDHGGISIVMDKTYSIFRAKGAKKSAMFRDMAKVVSRNLYKESHFPPGSPKKRIGFQDQAIIELSRHLFESGRMEQLVTGLQNYLTVQHVMEQ